MLIECCGMVFDSQSISDDIVNHLVWACSSFVNTEVVSDIIIVGDEIVFKIRVDKVEEAKLLVSEYEDGYIDYDEFEEELKWLSESDNVIEMRVPFDILEKQY